MHWHPGKSQTQGTRDKQDAKEKGAQDDRADRETGMKLGGRGRTQTVKAQSGRVWHSCHRLCPLEQGLNGGVPKYRGAGGNRRKAYIKHLEDYGNFQLKTNGDVRVGKEQDKTDASW